MIASADKRQSVAALTRRKCCPHDKRTHPGTTPGSGADGERPSPCSSVTASSITKAQLVNASS